jgi:hypothetical protein
MRQPTCIFSLRVRKSKFPLKNWLLPLQKILALCHRAYGSEFSVVPNYIVLVVLSVSSHMYVEFGLALADSSGQFSSLQYNSLLYTSFLVHDHIYTLWSSPVDIYAIEVFLAHHVCS